VTAGRTFRLAAIACAVAALARPQFAPADPLSVKLGLDLPLSGIDGASAIPVRNAVVLALESAARQGFPGGGRVELDDLDDSVQGKHDPAQGAQNVRAFVDDPTVLAFVGPMNSNVAKAEIPLSNAAGLAQITMAATAVELTRGTVAAQLRAARPGRPAFFRVCAADDRQGSAIAAFAFGRGLRRAFVIDDDESYGKGLADVFAEAFPHAGGTLLGREHLTAFALDYKALLTKIAAEHPDMIFFGGIVSTGGAILRKQMGDVGLGRLPYFGGDGLSSPEYVPLAGEAADNTFFSLSSPDIDRLPAARGFIAAYRKRFGAAPGAYSAGAYAAAEVALSAIRRCWQRHPQATPTREEVLRAVADSRLVPTPLGPVSFDQNGDVRRPAISVYRVERGKTEFVAQSTSP
jgi:branched-chain amino acid transport system substrate-binding protein